MSKFEFLIPSASRLAVFLPFLFLAALIAALVIGAYTLQQPVAPASTPVSSPYQSVTPLVVGSESDQLPVETFLPLQKLNLTPADAFARNLARPLIGSNPSPPAFSAAWLSPKDIAAATECLTTAIYYEANSEPTAGQLAVAQVVLNRVRHPRFPKTVCGVVYQGSERPTGCQFSFTCDGSLRRRPNPARWIKVRAVADAALHGAVSYLAGQATHYHTVWIVPVWAPELGKVAIINNHIFYRPLAAYGDYTINRTGMTGAIPTTGGVVSEPADSPVKAATSASLVQIPKSTAAPQQGISTYSTDALSRVPPPVARPSPNATPSGSSYFGRPHRRGTNLAIPEG